MQVFVSRDMLGLLFEQIEMKLAKAKGSRMASRCHFEPANDSADLKDSNHK